MSKFKPPQEHIENGLIRVQTRGSLRLYNYSEHCQFEQKWDEWTLASRGIVVDSENNVVARPFKKFFNWEELIAQNITLPWPPQTITEKADGSLGIVYWWDGDWRMNTRGSFESEQAIRGLQIFKTMLRPQKFAENIRQDCTHLFEIIYPENRIVVDYGQLETLVYLGSIVTETGEDVWLDEMERFHLPIRYKADKLEDLYTESQKNREGCVLKWSDGTRAKIKFEEYKRLHKLMTGVNERHIWEILKTGGTLEEILKRVPDEFFKWVSDTEAELKRQFSAIQREALTEYERILALANNDRKAFASFATKWKQPNLLFTLYDGRDPAEAIWKLIKPESLKSFRIEV